MGELHGLTMCGCDQKMEAGALLATDPPAQLSPEKNRAFARQVHAAILHTNNLIAQLPRVSFDSYARHSDDVTQFSPPRSGTSTPLRRIDQQSLQQWRNIRDSWARWYSRGRFAGQDAVMRVQDYAETVDAWRKAFGWPRWPFDYSAFRSRSLTASRSSGDAIISQQGVNNMAMAQPVRLTGNEGQWFVASGFDPSVDVRIVWQQHGRHVHAWARLVLPGGPPIMIHATTDLQEIERSLEAHPKIRAQMTAAGADVGWFGSKLFKGIKKAAKSIGINKVVNTVKGLAQKAWKNPLIQTALRATPYGQLALAINKGASIAQAALKGNLSAKNAIGHLVKQWKAGNPMAANALKFIKAGARQIRNAPAVCSGADDTRAFLALDQLYRPGPDTTAMGDDVEALLTFASAGAFEGTRWLLDRMSLRSMAAHPNEFTKRDALLSGRDVLASRFA